MNPVSFLWKEIRRNLRSPDRLPAPVSWHMLFPGGANSVQRAILAEYLKTGNSLARLSSLIVALLFWPWNSTVSAARLTREYGDQIASIRPKWQQFVQQLYLAWFHGISPSMYYHLGLCDSSTSIKPMEWFQSGHAGLLSRVFRQEKTLLEINDKALFERIMSSKSVPTPPTLAVLENGKFRAGFGHTQFVQAANEAGRLFMKPCRSSGGADVVCWGQGVDGVWRYESSPRTGTLIREALDSMPADGVPIERVIEFSRKISVGSEILVQRRLRNHAEISALTQCSGLASVRILSGLRRGTVVPMRAVIYLPAGKSITSQFGYPASVDLDTGIMGSLILEPGSALDAEIMPGTSNRVRGVKLPEWQELLGLLDRAHRALPDYAFLGWDIALTDEGPMVLEANGNYATDVLQKPGPKPLIDREFLSIFDAWRLDRANESNAFDAV